MWNRRRYMLATLCLLPALLFALPAEARSIVRLSGILPGEILIKTGERRLYYGVGFGKAISYPVGVGRTDRQWFGRRWIAGKRLKPAWRATPEILRDKPELVSVIPGGAPNNPMGAAALLISGSGQYAIHGTNSPGSIGGFVSYGCIRMFNEDIMDLYSRVLIGTPVTVQR